MRAYLISDNTETYEGMRLAGIDGMVTQNPALIAKAMLSLAKAGDCAMILLTERAYGLAKKEVDAFMAAHTRPIVTRIPDRHGALDRQDFADEFFQNGVGGGL